MGRRETIGIEGKRLKRAGRRDGRTKVGGAANEDDEG